MEYSAKFVPIDLVQIPVFGPGISTCKLNCWETRNLVILPVPKGVFPWYNVGRKSRYSEMKNLVTLLAYLRKNANSTKQVVVLGSVLNVVRNNHM